MGTSYGALPRLRPAMRGLIIGERRSPRDFHRRGAMRFDTDSKMTVRGIRISPLGWITDITLHRLYHVQVSGREHFTFSPSTLVVSNHLRDTDGPILAGVLANRRGFSIYGVQPHIVAREDLFRRGFLREYLTGLPQWMRELLSPIDMSRVMRSMQVCPIRRIPEMSLGEILEDVAGIFGDLPLRHVLKDRWTDRFEAIGGHTELTVKRVIHLRYRPLLRLRHGLSKLNPAFFQILKPYEKEIISAQLQYVLHLLENGRTVQLQPEGIISRNGCMAPFRNGLHLLISRSRVPIRVLPVGITYDFMTAGRPRMFVNIGPELTDLSAGSRKAVNALIAKAILAQSTVTAAHLAGSILNSHLRRGKGITANELITCVGREAARRADAGFHVDPCLLSDSALSKRIHDLLGFGMRAGAIIRQGDRLYNARSESAPTNLCDRNAAIHPVPDERPSFRCIWPGFREDFSV